MKATGAGIGRHVATVCTASKDMGPMAPLRCCELSPAGTWWASAVDLEPQLAVAVVVEGGLFTLVSSELI